ncbi:MAG: ADP-ribosylglycohydrolase family protein [Nocardioides sp.]|uniref:ADP-ribosylglycohydrolase family protein n=1 Tax=Nocardioides sp. TaxID=35761 RepID=UPI003F125B7E
MRLSHAQLDRAHGVLLGCAVGDALGAGYEFGSAPYEGRPAMIGGGLGNFTPGEWTDDTAQAVAIARVGARGLDLRSEDALDAVADGFSEWFAAGPADVGIQTSRVLQLAGRSASASQMTRAATDVHRENGGRSAGNGSLMRTAPVALAHLIAPEREVVQAAMALSALTHHDPLAGQGAALWSLMVQHAVLHGEFADPRDLLRHVPDSEQWVDHLDAAEKGQPETFSQNAWVVGALQAAWSSIVHTPEPGCIPCAHLPESLARAIGIGHDTDTVAAIAGTLLGARWGASAIPLEWRRMVHGWGAPVDGARELARLTTGALGAAAGRPPRVVARPWAGGGVVPHPLLDGVWLADTDPQSLSHVVDALMTVTALPGEGAHGTADEYVVGIADEVAGDNPNLEFVLDDAARTVVRLQRAGRSVCLHGASGAGVTAVAARAAVLAGHDLANALIALRAVVPTHPSAFLVEALQNLDDIDAAKRDLGA